VSDGACIELHRGVSHLVDDNRRRALAEVVTAEAWHAAFSNEKPQVDLHVDVAFGRGRIGGGDSSGVRFRLSLRRAEIVVILPELEPVRVATATVRRDTPRPVTGKIESRGKVSTKAGVDVAAHAVAGVISNASAKATARFSFGKSRDRTVLATQSFSGMSVLQSKTSEDHYRWTISPDVSGTDRRSLPSP